MLTNFKKNQPQLVCVLLFCIICIVLCFDTSTKSREMVDNSKLPAVRPLVYHNGYGYKATNYPDYATEQDMKIYVEACKIEAFAANNYELDSRIDGQTSAKHWLGGTVYHNPSDDSMIIIKVKQALNDGTSGDVYLKLK